MLENYCPLYRPLINCNSFSPLDSLNGEETGPNSACFMSTITQNTSNSIPSNVDMAPMCYHAVCTQPNVIKIRILDYWYTCYDGEEKAIYPTGFSGSIQCPRSVRSFCVKRFLGSYMKWPEITGVSTSYSGSKGGSKIWIKGLDFTFGSQIFVNGIQALHTFWESSTTLTIFTPPIPKNFTRNYTMSVVDGSVKWKKSHYLEAITYFEEDVVYIYAGHSKPSILEMILLLSTYYWIWACEKGDPGIFLLILTYCITIFCGLVVSFYYYCIPPMKVDARLLRASDPSLLLWIFVWFQRICFCRRFRERYYPVRSAYAPIQRQPKAPTVLPPKPPTPQTPRKRRAWGESMESKLPAPPVMPRENPGLSPRNAQ
eukprot:TRINITY_DN6177_c0_g1_i22.p1 TRINITY_DN6177_c0_g1~~TRINITY_DN6177_c0_g1_i22.p1  ORF type:complete len:371 (+),score=29.78 TRINITY_DN6177_c0_g1_i22:295-1407(+)